MKKETLKEIIRATNELKGVGKILDILWGNSFYAMGREASRRIEQEMIYYFGKNWSTTMYKLIEDGELPHEIEPVKTLKELKKLNCEK